jgi:leucyl-tRNA synthetase
MAVPAHDERDYAFAQAHDLPIRTVVVPHDESQAATHDEAAATLEGAGEDAYSGGGVLVKSGPFTGLDNQTAKARIIAWAEENGFGTARTTFRLRDWLISRQRYWGPPIPIVYCERCGIVPVPEDDLPVLLPDVENFRPEAGGASPLAAIESFVHTTCPTCQGPARRDTDVSDNFLDSAWYFLRYPSTDVPDRPFDEVRTRTWLPVDMYIGGREHSVLHLMYTRFVCMVLHDMGYLDFEEPFRVFRAHGTVIHDGAKMSKSRGNVVNPDELFDRYGADTVRTYLMFMGPFQEGGDYSDASIQGVFRFLNRVWDLCQEVAASPQAVPESEPGSDALERARHRTIRKVTEDLSELRDNTAVAALMEYLNTLNGDRAHVTRTQAETLLLLLSPFAPAIADELWESLGHTRSIARESWPKADERYLVDIEVEIPVQVNGRLRDRLTVPLDLPEAEAVRRALLKEAVVRAVGEPGSVRRVVYVPGRMLNLVAPAGAKSRAQAGD